MTSEIELANGCAREHQTVVFIQVPSAKSHAENYWERARRLATSYNHNETIKADIRVVRQSESSLITIASSKAKNVETALPPIAKNIPLDYNALQKWATDQAYNLVVFATVPGTDMSGNKKDN